MITHPGDLAEASSYETEQDGREDEALHGWPVFVDFRYFSQ